jgi:hypothetical protein
MIFDGLLSRTRLRSNMAERSELEVGFPAQVRYSTRPVLVSVLNRMSAHSHWRILRNRVLLKESDHRGWLEHMVLFLS